MSRGIFEARRARSPYRSDAAELDAVAAGTKALFYLPVSSDPAEHADLYRAALARGLSVVIDPDDADSVHLFALRHGEMWRIPALRALWATAFVDGAWSNAAEIQMSTLLGYSRAACKAHLAALRHEHAAWGARTVYAIVDRARDLADLVGIELLYRPDQIVKRAPKLPAGSTLIRFALAHREAQLVFGTKQRATLTAKSAALVAGARRSDVQRYARGAWLSSRAGT